VVEETGDFKDLVAFLAVRDDVTSALETDGSVSKSGSGSFQFLEKTEHAL